MLESILKTASTLVMTNILERLSNKNFLKNTFFENFIHLMLLVLVCDSFKFLFVIVVSFFYLLIFTFLHELLPKIILGKICSNYLTKSRHMPIHGARLLQQ